MGEREREKVCVKSSDLLMERKRSYICFIRELRVRKFLPLFIRISLKKTIKYKYFYKLFFFFQITQQQKNSIYLNIQHCNHVFFNFLVITLPLYLMFEFTGVF